MVNASVGERIQFVARLSNVENNQYGVVADSQKLLTSKNFIPFDWAFAESNYNTPCIYNQGNLNISIG